MKDTTDRIGKERNYAEGAILEKYAINIIIYLITRNTFKNEKCLSERPTTVPYIFDLLQEIKKLFRRSARVDLASVSNVRATRTVSANISQHLSRVRNRP